MIVTSYMLKQRNACQEQIELFIDVFGHAALLSRENILLATIVGLDISWLITSMTTSRAINTNMYNECVSGVTQLTDTLYKSANELWEQELTYIESYLDRIINSKVFKLQLDSTSFRKHILHRIYFTTISSVYITREYQYNLYKLFLAAFEGSGLLSKTSWINNLKVKFSAYFSKKKYMRYLEEENGY